MQLLSAVLCHVLLQSPGGLRKPDRDYDQLGGQATTEEAIYWGDSALIDRSDAPGVENVVRFKRTFTTDAAGNWASVYESGPDGNLRDRTDYSYDEDADKGYRGHYIQLQLMTALFQDRTPRLVSS